jgi:hypothetical protein
MRKKKQDTVAQRTLMSISEMKDMECSKCHNTTAYVSVDVTKLICHRCVAIMAGPPEEFLLKQIKSETASYPRGWHLKHIFISEGGKYYTKGREITKAEAKVIQTELDNPVPKVEVKKKATKPVPKIVKKRKTKPR